MSESNQIIRLVYASIATFKPYSKMNSEDDSMVKANEYIANIIEISRNENVKNQIVGVLFYGNGYFFQCLEGTQSSVEKLYAKLLKDSRHTDLKILTTHAIDKQGFSGWELKFATINPEIRSFLKNHDMDSFNPYQFDPTMTDTLVEILQNV